MKLRILVFSVLLLQLPAGLTYAQQSKRLFAAVARSLHTNAADNAETMGLLASPLDNPKWAILTWPGLPLNTIAKTSGSGSPKLLAAGPTGILLPFTNPTGWRLLTDWHLTEVLDVEVDPTSERIIYAATAVGVFISKDNGKEWKLRNQGLTSNFVSCVLADPKQSRRLLAGTEAGLFESLNGGDDWRLLALPDVAVRALLREKESWPGIFWVGTEYHGIYESFDGAKTFTKVDMDDDSSSVYTLAGGGANEPIYAGLFEQGMYRAASPGELWERMRDSEKLGTVLCILPLHERQMIFAGTYDKGVFLSVDGGQTWQNFGLEGAPVRDLLLGESSWAKP